ncbi:uncharacterized protein BJ171DRAFT_538068 [Polychytrium aggregatum]|uniref:uncharacterized protein n=1 Tax=Polychytrium aggregatum TaxID=110093 RepID=UPI0022FF18D2|nr:uncharacterized protein BJ171DRAFT_538068 [Polychytrium aggregatum]KAI9192925.1 hypothetical protein BJ171DRAFT_538068 [Polychytrium aggregatum]
MNCIRQGAWIARGCVPEPFVGDINVEQPDFGAGMMLRMSECERCGWVMRWPYDSWLRTFRICGPKASFGHVALVQQRWGVVLPGLDWLGLAWVGLVWLLCSALVWSGLLWSDVLRGSALLPIKQGASLSQSLAGMFATLLVCWQKHRRYGAGQAGRLGRNLSPVPMPV